MDDVVLDRISFGTRVRWCTLRKLLGSGRLGVVLDIGSGKSVLWSFLNGRYSVWINLDRFIDSPRPERLPDRVWQLEGDAHALPIRSGSLDTVCLVSVLEHFDSASLAMREIRRVLAPAGRIILTVPRDPRRFFLHRPDLVGALGHRRFGYSENEIVGLLEGIEVEALGYAFHFPGQVGWELSHLFNQRYAIGWGWRLLYAALLFLENQYSTRAVGNEIVIVGKVRIGA